MSLDAQISGAPANLSVKGVLQLGGAGQWRLAYQGKLDLEQIRGIRRASYATSLVLSEVQTLLSAAETLKLIDRHVEANSIIAQL